MSSYYGGTFDETFKDLKKRLPCGFPVKLRTSSVKEITKFSGKKDGDRYAIAHINYDKNDKPIQATIYIARNLHRELAEYILIHEYAHVLSPIYGNKEHGSDFGRNYAKCWCVYCDEHIITRKCSNKKKNRKKRRK